MPKTSSEDRLASATEDLIAILQKPHPPTPFLDQGTKTKDAIKKLSEIFTPRQRNKAPGAGTSSYKGGGSTRGRPTTTLQCKPSSYKGGNINNYQQ